MLDSLNFSRTRHAGIERTDRGDAVNKEGGGFGNEVLAVYYVDRNHPNGPELHWITDNAIVLITNALRDNGLSVCTYIPARPGQLRRYPTGDNPSFAACEQVFPDKDWKVPNWLIGKAEQHQRMGLNYRESRINEKYQLGDLLQDRQEIAWDYVMYYADKRTLNAIRSDSELEEKVREAVYDAVEREVPDVTDDDDDFTKSCEVGMKAALQTCMEYTGKMAAESFMDTVKSGWKKIKRAFSDLPQVKLVGKNGKTETGYLHDINKKKGTCTFMLPRESNESAAITAAVASSMAMRRRDREEYDDYDDFSQSFEEGDTATLVGAEEDLGSNKIPVEVTGFDNCGGTKMYYLKFLDGEVKEGTETNPRFKCMESEQSGML